MDFKEQCRIFYMVKGHLNSTPETIKKCYESYFKRVWYDEETYYKLDGFEDCYHMFMMGAK